MTLTASMSSPSVSWVPPLHTLAPAPGFWKRLRPRTLSSPHSLQLDRQLKGRLQQHMSKPPTVLHLTHVSRGCEVSKSDRCLPWGASSLARLPARTWVWVSVSVCQGRAEHMPVSAVRVHASGACSAHNQAPLKGEDCQKVAASLEGESTKEGRKGRPTG